MMPAYLRLQRTLAKVGPAVIEIPERRKFNHNLIDPRIAEEVIIRIQGKAGGSSSEFFSVHTANVNVKKKNEKKM